MTVTVDARKTGRPAGGRFVGEYSWSELMALTGLQAGDWAWVRDLAATGRVSQWYYDGTSAIWRPVAPTTIAVDTASYLGAPQTADQYLGSGLLLPVGILKGARIAYRYALGKDGTTDAYGTATNIRVGTAGTTADASVVLQNYSTIITSGARSFGAEPNFRFPTNTTIQRQGTQVSSGGAGSSFAGAFGGSVAPETTTAVPDISSTAVYIGVSTTMGGTTNKPQITHQEVVRLT